MDVPQFLLCVANDADSLAALEVRELYEVIPDSKASEVGMVRVVDESGEDYLYPAHWFVELPLPAPVVSAFVARR